MTSGPVVASRHGYLPEMLYHGWPDLWRVAVIGVSTYPVLILFLRLSGKRTLAKMNAFDLVVTVALGSTLATILLSKSVTLTEGLLALLLLVILQLVLTWLSVRSDVVRRLVKSEPTVLLRDGRMLTTKLMAQRVTEGELRQAVRSQGIGDLDEVAAVVLETDGSFSVIPSSQAGRLTALPPHADPTSGG